MKHHKPLLTILCSIFLWMAAGLPVLHFPSPNKVEANRFNTNSSSFTLPRRSKIDLDQFMAGGFRACSTLAPKDSFQLLQLDVDQKGGRHALLQQTHDGIPVYGAWLRVHEKDGLIKTARGQVFTITNINTTPALGGNEALKKALEIFPAQKYAWQDTSFQLALQQRTNDPKASFYPKPELRLVPELSYISNTYPISDGSRQAPPLKLAWVLDILAIEPVLKKMTVFVDATEGTLLYQLPNLPHCTVPAFGKAAYRSDWVAINTDSCSSLPSQPYRLFDSQRNIRIYDARNSNGTPLIGFHHDDTTWLPPAADTVAIAAMYGLSIWYDYMLENFGWRGLDGTGERPLQAWVHYRNNFENAVYSGFLLFGDGNPNGRWKNPMVSRDIIFHEATHGLVEYTSRLLYVYESGILNEAIADIFACLIELEQGDGNWTLGEDILFGGNRRLDAPNLAGFPDTYRGNFWREQATPGMSLHHNSNVLGFWAYLLTAGQTGTNDFGTNYSVLPIGHQQLAKLLFHTMRYYLNPNDGFFGLRQATLEAASDLNWNQADIDNLAMAWCAIGVGNCSPHGNDSLNLLSPYGGEVYAIGEEIPLEWESSPGVTGIDVLISFNDGANWQPLTTFPTVGNSGTLSITAPNVNSHLCRLRIVATNDPLAFDESEEAFSIVGCNLLASFLTNPEGGCSSTTFVISNTSHNTTASFRWRVDGEDFPAAPNGFRLQNLNPGPHVIQLIAEEEACRDTFTHTIEVAPIPNADFSSTSSNLLITAAALFPFGEQYFWSISGLELPEFDGAQSLSWTAPGPGEYEICLYVEDHCSAEGITQCKSVTIEAAEECLGTTESWIQYNNFSEVTDMVELGDTLILATSGGLVIYNKTSQQLERVYHTASSPSLPCQTLGSIAVDRANNWVYVAISPDQGFIKVDLDENTITQYTTWTLPELLSNEITVLRVDPTGNLWVGTKDNGIWVGKPGVSFQNLFFTELPDKQVIDIDFPDESSAWVATKSAIIRIESEVVTRVYQNETLPRPASTNVNINTLLADNTKLWVGSTKGLYLLENETWTLFDNDDYDHSGTHIVDIDKRSDGSIAFASALNSNLLLYDGTSFQVIKCLYEAATTGAGGINRLVATSDHIWLACKRGLYTWNSTDACQKQETGTFPVPTNEIDKVLIRRNGTTLAIHEESLIEIDGVSINQLNIDGYLPGGASNIHRLSMRELVEDETGALWVNLVYTYQKKYYLARRSPVTGAWQFYSEDVLPFDRQISSLKYRDRKLYIATSTGLYIWDLERNSWNIYNEENSPYWNYGTNTIMMHFDPEGNLWMANSGFLMNNNRSDRLLKFNGVEWETIPIESSFVSAFTFTHDGTLWVASGIFNPPYFTKHLRKYQEGGWELLSPITSVLNTDRPVFTQLITGMNDNLLLASSNGIYTFDQDGNVLEHQTLCNSGLVGNQVNALALNESKQELWMATDKGLAKYSPAAEIIEPSFTIPTEVCVGLPTELTSNTIGATAFEWWIAEELIGTESQISHTFTEIGPHIVELVSINAQGCRTSLSKTINVHPVASLENLPEEIIECNAFRQICAPGGMAFYRWVQGSLTLSNQPCIYLDQSESGIYELEITDHCGNVQRKVIRISLSGTCVWAGDTNSDGVVNFLDLLWLGYTFGYTGPARTERGINWKQYPAFDWNANLPVGANFKHCDPDGSGVIDLSDVEAINFNYLNSHGTDPGLPNPAESPYTFEPLLVAVDTTLGENLYRIVIDIVAQGTASGGGLSNFYGAGMRLYYNLPPGVQLIQAPEFSFNNSSIGIEGTNAVGLVKPFLDRGFMDIAFTRMDHQNPSDVDTLGRAYFIAADDHLPIFDSLKLTLSVIGATSITNEGNFIPIDGSERTFNFSSDQITNDVHPISDHHLTIYPNPTSGLCLVEVPHSFAQEVSIQVFNTHGTEVLETAMTGQTFIQELDLRAFPSGLYWVVIHSTAGRIVQKVVKQ